MDRFHIATLARPRQPVLTFPSFTTAEAQKARDFHASFPIYQPTPHTSLPNLAQALWGSPAMISISLESPASVRFFSQTSPMGMGEASERGRKTTGAFSSSGQE